MYNKWTISSCDNIGGHRSRCTQYVNERFFLLSSQSKCPLNEYVTYLLTYSAEAVIRSVCEQDNSRTR